MVEAKIHLRPLHTSILDIYKVCEPLECCFKGIWLHPYTVTLAKLAPDLVCVCVNLVSSWERPFAILRTIKVLWLVPPPRLDSCLLEINAI